jgi:hypothetical protein
MFYITINGVKHTYTGWRAHLFGGIFMFIMLCFWGSCALIAASPCIVVGAVAAGALP